MKKFTWNLVDNGSVNVYCELHFEGERIGWLTHDSIVDQWVYYWDRQFRSVGILALGCDSNELGYGPSKWSKVHKQFIRTIKDRLEELKQPKILEALAWRLKQIGLNWNLTNRRIAQINKIGKGYMTRPLAEINPKLLLP